MSAEYFIAHTWFDAFRKPDRRPIYDWAHDNITQLPAVYGDRRQFSVTGSRHFIAPFHAIQSPRIHEISVLAPVRSGKTLLADISIPWFIAEEHASVLWVLQTDDVAKEHAELRLWPILEHSPVANLFPSQRHQKRNQEIVFANGQPLFIKGPSKSNLQSRGFRVVVLDEPWLYDSGIMQEAKGRLGDFVRLGNHKFICIAQGGSYGQDWQVHTESCRRYEWEVACTSCGQYFEPRWTGYRQDGSRWGIVWETRKLANGDVDVEVAQSSVAMECPHCRERHKFSRKLIGAWNESGRFRDWDLATAPDKVLFHWEAVIDFPWNELVAEWLAAKKAQALGNYEPLKIFIQKRLADHDNPSGASPHAIVHEFATFEDGQEWPEAGPIIMTVDVQRTHYWVMVAQVSKVGGVVRRLFFGKAESDASVDDIRSRFKPHFSAVDVNWKKNKDNTVFRFACHRKMVGLIGDQNRAFPHFIKKVTGQTERVERVYSETSEVDAWEGSRDVPTKERICPVIRFSSDAMASRLQRLIDTKKWQEPNNEPDPAKVREYQRQMSAEHREYKKDATGKIEEKWIRHSSDNHAWDCAKMILAICTILADSTGAAKIEF